MYKILIVEDNNKQRREYANSLKRKGFDVFEIENGFFLESTLRAVQFDAVLCDTKMRRVDGMNVDGPKACCECRKKGLLTDEKGEDNIVLIAMSDNPDNQYLWRGLAHHFYNKKDIWDIEEQVYSSVYNFKRGGIWRERMPIISEQ